MKASADGGGCFPTGRHYPGIAHLLRITAQGLADEFDGQTAISEIPFVGIDTETTGREPGVDRIVELAAVSWRGGEVVDRKSWLIDPTIPIPQDAFEVHGIGTDDVRGKPTFDALVPEILEALKGAVPVAYNADFDKRMLHAELTRAGMRRRGAPPAARRDVEWVDSFVWAAELLKDEKKKTLTAICDRLGIEIGQAHRATDDAEAALKVMAAFAKDDRVPRTYAAFIQEQRRLAREHAAERVVWKMGTTIKKG